MCDLECSCCVCATPVAASEGVVGFPLPVLRSVRGRWHATWLRISDRVLYIRSVDPPGNIRIELPDDPTLYVKVRDGGCDVLRALHAVRMRAVALDRPCCGVAGPCARDALVVPGDSPAPLFDSVYSMTATEDDEDARAPAGKRARPTRRLKDLPAAEWTQDALKTHFSDLDRELSDDPLLHRVVSVSTLKFGLPVYRCEWKHPEGAKVQTVHGIVDMIPNDALMAQVDAAARHNETGP